MLTIRRYQVLMGRKGSKWCTTNNGLPQESVLTPTLFNLYLHDKLDTKELKFQFAVDITVVHRSNELKDGSGTLNDDLARFIDYFC